MAAPKTRFRTGQREPSLEVVIRSSQRRAESSFVWYDIDVLRQEISSFWLTLYGEYTTGARIGMSFVD